VLLDICQKDSAVHRPIHDQRSRQRGHSQSGYERGRLPMPMRHVCDQTLTAQGAAEATSHLGVGARFIEKHEPPAIHCRPPESPGDAAVLHIRPLLLSRMQDFF